MFEHWTEWFDQHGPALVLYARQWVSCRADAEDVVQTAFVRFWRNRDRAESPLAYLYRCVASVALDWQRGEQRRRQREREVWFVSVSPAAEVNGLADVVQEAVTRLPLEQRQVIVMKTWGGLTFEEIGGALTISPNTAASRYRYALAALREVLGKEWSRVE